jgi:hypothetical protein
MPFAQTLIFLALAVVSTVRTAFAWKSEQRAGNRLAPGVLWRGLFALLCWGLFALELHRLFNSPAQ